MINLIDYGFIPTTTVEDTHAIPARITAVHKGRYELICEYGKTYAKPRKTIVFLGSSRVGKSSLVNALTNQEIMTVNTIRVDDSKPANKSQA